MKRLLFGIAGCGVLVAMSTSPALANHAWNDYHWATRGTAFTLSLGNNLTTTEWQNDLATVSSQWSSAPAAKRVLSTSVVVGNDIGRQKRCRPTSGRVEVCNARYGRTGWLGVATIWITSGSHIVQGTVKVNDTYLAPDSFYTYNTAEERLHVICQEVGHTFGLDHQDTSGATYGTCMDYFHNVSRDARSTEPYQAPHSCTGTGHDDGMTTVGAAGYSPAAAELPAWANPSRDAYVAHLPNGLTQISFVTWASRA